LIYAMQKRSLPYGKTSLTFELPEGHHCFPIQDPDPTITPALFRKRLKAALVGRDLCRTDIAVAVADKTRLCGYPDYLPVLLEALAEKGATPERITFFIAYGTHPRQEEATSLAAYGDTWRSSRFVHHDCTDETLFAKQGATTRGTPVMIRRDILAADYLVTFGAVSHHYFAGFGGGRKLIFPGLGCRKAIYHNHGLFLDRRTRGLHSGCQPGRLAGNPLAEDLAEVEAFRPADLAIHGILDSHGQVCDLQVGSGSKPFLDACDTHAGYCEVPCGRSFDTVLASCGGHPKDINFIQAHKALHNAAAFVEDGGRLILLARCPDGIGSTTFLPWFAKGSERAAFDELAAAYCGNGGTALSMMAKTRRIRVGLVTDLDNDTTRRIGAVRITPERAGKQVRTAAGGVAVIPNASLAVKRQP
jgi:nickel-dependent lactate racemase